MRTVADTFSQNLGGIAHTVASTHQKFSCDDVPDLSGKVVVVTCGSEGIGFGCTHTLLAKNISKLFLISPSQEVVEKAIDAVREELEADAAARTKWIQCDLSDWPFVGKVANEIRPAINRLDILINNAGRGIMSHQLTNYGMDRHMAVNHMGRVVRTGHLLNLMKKTADQGHVVWISNQASNAQESAPKDTRFESLEEINTDLGPLAQYGRAKLTGILYARYLARHLTSKDPNVLVNATHPGVVEMKMSAEVIREPYPLAGYLMSVGLSAFKKDQFEVAASTL